MTTIDLKEANFARIENCASIALLGKRRTGKTTWAKWIVQYISEQCDRFVVMCGNRDNMSEWREIISPLNVLTKNGAFLTKLRDYQDRKCSSFTVQGKEIPQKYKITLIFDDCGADRTFMHSDIMKDILSNGRHYGMFIIILAQYLNQMHAENRDQLDYIGVLYTSNQRNIKKLWEEYISVVEMRTFKYILKALTSKKGLCWIDNTQNPACVSDCIFFKHMTWPCDVKPVGSLGVRSYSQQHFMGSNKPKKPAAKVNMMIGKATIDVDTDGEEDDEEPTLFDTFAHLPEILPNRSMFHDRRGSVIIRKTLTDTKEKME
jgi:hypothetical protein